MFDLQTFMINPLFNGRSGFFLRLVLAEAGGYGMPPDLIAILDDIGAMLGFYPPLPDNQSRHLAGPMVAWRTTRMQPSMERVEDVEQEAVKQRALVAFGGAPQHHQVGTAEILVAMGNIIKGEHPEPYYDVFTWAATDVLSKMLDQTPEQIRKDRTWPTISDAHVVLPSGRLYKTYTEIATEIRRQAIAGSHHKPDTPRDGLKPLAVVFMQANLMKRAQAEKDGKPHVVADLDETIATIEQMFPGTIEATKALKASAAQMAKDAVTPPAAAAS